MYPRLSPDERRLLELAREQAATLSDAELQKCWSVLVNAISQRWVVPEGRMSLQELIDELDDGGGAGAEEYTIDVDDEDPSRIRAVFVNERYRCPRDAMLAQLRRLEARRRGGGASTTTGEPADPTAGLPDPEALRRLMQRFLGAETELPVDTTEAARIRAEVRDELARLNDSPEALASDDLRAAMEGLSDADRTNMAAALRTFADWAEQPERGGHAVDAAIEMLERTLGKLARGKAADAQATRERIAQSARDAIARRLGNHPAQP